MLNAQELQLIANEVLLEVINNILNKNVTQYGALNNTGKAVNSLSTNLKPNGFQIVSSEFYPSLFEQGREPGKFPPITAIKQWVAQRFGLNGKELDRVAFLVARKIAQKGTLLWQLYGSQGRGSGVLSMPITNENLLKIINRVAPSIAKRKELEFTARLNGKIV